MAQRFMKVAILAIRSNDLQLALQFADKCLASLSVQDPASLTQEGASLDTLQYVYSQCYSVWTYAKDMLVARQQPQR